MLELTKLDAPDGPLCARLQGVVDVEILRRALRELASFCGRDEGAQIILDLHEAESRCSLLDVRSLGDELSRLGFQASWRMAIVGSQQNAGFALFETVGRRQGMKVRFFRNQEAARHWLVSRG